MAFEYDPKRYPTLGLGSRVGSAIGSLGNWLSSPPTGLREVGPRANMYNQGIWSKYQDPRDYIRANAAGALGQRQGMPDPDYRNPETVFKEPISGGDYAVGADQSAGYAGGAPAIPTAPVAASTKMAPASMLSFGLPDVAADESTVIKAMMAYDKLPSVKQTPVGAASAYAKAIAESAKSLPGKRLPETREEGFRNTLSDQGFVPVSSLPGSIDPRSGTAYLGPSDNILVREGLVPAERYNAAMQNREAAMAAGQRVGLPKSLEGGRYEPNAETLYAMAPGGAGAITEYAIPGKGTATFLGERRGGGALSVVGGRTPEEQQAIDQTVKGIESQTAAMRDLRNANRLAQGAPTVEQEEYQSQLARIMGPGPNLSRLDEAQAGLLQDLKEASGIRGIGKKRLREDKIKAAQLGLATIQAAREDAMGDYAQQRNAALGAWQNQQTLASKQQESLRAAQQWAAEQGLEWNKLTQQQQNAVREQADKGFSRMLDLERLILDAGKAQREGIPKIDSRLIQAMMTPSIRPGEPSKLNPEALSLVGIRPMPTQGQKPFTPYFNPQTSSIFMLNENGQPVDLPLQQALAYLQGTGY
jgi:hypothetical protein